MNRFDKIIAEKLNASNEHAVDHGMWEAIEKQLPQTQSASGAGSTGFNTSLYGGIAASVLLGILFTQLPDLNSVANGSDALVANHNTTATNEVEVTPNPVSDLSDIFQPQEEHEIEFSSIKVVETSKKQSTQKSPEKPTQYVEAEPKAAVTQDKKSISKTNSYTETDQKVTPEFDFNASGIQCAGGEIVFTSSAASDLDIRWVFDGVHVKEGKTSAFTFNEHGMHEVMMLVDKDLATYSVGKEIRIFSKPSPQIALSSGSNETCFRQKVDLKAEPGSNSYLWNITDQTFEGSEASLNLPSGNYSVALRTINEHGCLSETTQNIVVEEGLKVLIPNSFTPDNNGINDEWFPKGLEKCAKYRVSVYRFENRSLVYETTENRPWTGDISGTSERPSRGDQFIYEIIAWDECGFTKKYSDILTVL